MILELSSHERLQFQYILPVQGSLRTLELVEKILDKVKISDVQNIDSNKKIDFDKNESGIMVDMIHFLDQNQQLNIQSLSLIHKILKETK